MMMKRITGAITVPKGFLASGMHSGIKTKRKDLAIIFSQHPASVAGTFTQHAFAAAPVIWSRQVVARAKARAIVVNSGNANACTGRQGDEDAKKMASLVASGLSIPQTQVLVASTGIIGKLLPMTKITSGINKLAHSLSKKGASDAAQAILTTDRVPKRIAYEMLTGNKPVRIAGIAKGAGMIAPNMATMLCFITTDANISSKLLNPMLIECVEMTFNRITVDGDMSTNDMVLILANGASETPLIRRGTQAYRQFKDMLYHVCLKLAKSIAADGEGATKLIRVRVNGAKTQKDAKQAAFAIANYSLFKISVYAQNISWGRMLAALGSSGVKGLELSRIDVNLNGKIWVKKGKGGLIEDRAFRRIAKSKEIWIDVSLRMGKAQETVWTCDLTHQYIEENM
ncbi:MAG: bifunctional glutamate N-acetyltransferase/amino-acid acetyltransferase ArgJ [Chlamydiota bacterium]|nr:bifunctional glutamate N-acetyltransferase/amino-acid acetyltransferase ArgJ [Chlamydiota bacterium]